MRTRKTFARTLFFLFLLICLLGGLIGFVGVPVDAAPDIQATPPPTLQVIISEIAWGGTVAAPSTDEWIELFNPGPDPIDLDQWLLVSEGTPPNINISLSGSIAPGDYFLLERQNDGVVSTINADLIYFGPGNLLNNAGDILYLYAPDLINGTGYILVDVVNNNGGSWPAGIANGYGSMERYGVYPDNDNVWVTNPNPDPALNEDFRGNLIYGTPKNQNWAETITPFTTTTITSDSPDPSVPNSPVNVAVTVVGGPTVATGTVSISGADTNCTITLVNGAGNCNIDFATIGNKTITASYSGDAQHSGSTDTEPHQVVNGILTTTTITNINPDPAFVNESVNISVSVLGTLGSGTPSGTVSISGANTNCTITLNSNGTGNCNVTFTSIGVKTITATYNGFGAYQPSSDSENVDLFFRSTTTITADSPDPSLTNSSVSVSVTVSGTGPVPSGTVDITGASSNCSITLVNGTGSCNVIFNTSGTKTLRATYSGDSFYSSSNDTETHLVSFATRTATPRPTTVPPPPPLIAINEFVPRPGSDWNGDGVVNTDDEYIELLNHGVVSVNLSGYRLDDEVNIGSSPFALPSITLQPGERIVFYGSETGLLLSDGGDGVRLLRPNGVLMDAYNYFVVNRPDQAFCRLPDNGGADDWNTNCFPTPGLPNSLSGTVLRPPTETDSDRPLCPIADTLPEEFVLAECTPFGNNIWNRHYWDRFGWFGERSLLFLDSKWAVYAD